ncbi:MAG: Rieske (2Fe-2S) protein [Chloroflexota bacterium]
MKRMSRREFLRQVTNFLFGLAGLLGLGGLARYFSFQTDPGPPTEFDLGPVAAYPPGITALRPEVPALIRNDGSGIVAFSLACTHLGCTVEANEDGFTCPCHGSRYDRDGMVLQGPARESLRRLRVEILEDETLRLFTDGGRP